MNGRLKRKCEAGIGDSGCREEGNLGGGGNILSFPRDVRSSSLSESHKK